MKLYQKFQRLGLYTSIYLILVTIALKVVLLCMYHKQTTRAAEIYHFQCIFHIRHGSWNMISPVLNGVHSGRITSTICDSCSVLSVVSKHQALSFICNFIKRKKSQWPNPVRKGHHAVVG